MTSTDHAPCLDDDKRKHPLRKPPGHKPPVPRWTLRFDDDIDHLYTLYIGIQSHTPNAPVTAVSTQILTILKSSEAVIDHLQVTHGFDIINTKIFVCYYTSLTQFETTLKNLNLVTRWHSLTTEKHSVGLWLETLRTPIARFEANYASLAHRPGAAQLPRTTQPPHQLTAYWGSARDRLPASSHHLFPLPADDKKSQPPDRAPVGLAQRLFGSNYDHTTHIRSGQFWASCDDEEKLAYETILRPKLMTGMAFLMENPVETGTLGLRFVRSWDDATGRARDETAGVGWFRNLSDLEKWSRGSPSHVAIWKGAMDHAARFGAERKFMTWHEVSVLKEGEGWFEYVNCGPGTGVMDWMKLECESLV